VIRYLLAFFALTLPAAAFAQSDVTLTSEMFVERTVPQANGTAKTVLEKPDSVPPGAKLVFVLSYRNQGSAPAANFSVTNPIPAGVAFESAVDGGSEVSVNGGTNWGSLGTARVRNPDGTTRAARPDEVTHVRWVLKSPIAVGGQGKLSFTGTVK